LRLFCFPYAGGGASIFRTWSAGLPATIEVCPVQLPGRETRLKEAPYPHLPPLVQAMTQALMPSLDKPFAFFGHSMGALVSFALARQLCRQANLRPVHLFVSACSAPQFPLLCHALHTLPDPELIEELRRLNGTPQAALACPELMQLMLPILRADFAMCATYAYASEPPLDCPITVFGGMQDVAVRRERLQAWRFQTGAACAFHTLPGDHFFLHTAQLSLLSILAQELHQHVKTIAARSTP
jgi:medium-chain acyl-[acyl-carrier-protein] hydrolase